MLGIAGYAAADFVLSGPWRFAAGSLVLAAVFFAAWNLWPQARGYGALVRGPHGRKEIALTFDDGPNGETTQRVLDVLRAKDVKATFFLVGQHVERAPDLARRVHDEGHAIGNHTHTHRKLVLSSPRTIRHELARAQAAIETATGARPTLLRAPHGLLSPFLPGAMRRAGLKRVCAWTRGVWDSEPAADPDRLVSRATWRPRGGAVILLHDGDGRHYGANRDPTVAALPIIIDRYRDKGFRFVTLPEWVDE